MLTTAELLLTGSCEPTVRRHEKSTRAGAFFIRSSLYIGQWFCGLISEVDRFRINDLITTHSPQKRVRFSILPLQNALRSICFPTSSPRSGQTAAPSIPSMESSHSFFVSQPSRRPCRLTCDYPERRRGGKNSTQ